MNSEMPHGSPCLPSSTMTSRSSARLSSRWAPCRLGWCRPSPDWGLVGRDASHPNPRGPGEVRRGRRDLARWSPMGPGTTLGPGWLGRSHEVLPETLEIDPKITWRKWSFHCQLRLPGDRGNMKQQTSGFLHGNLKLSWKDWDRTVAGWPILETIIHNHDHVQTPDVFWIRFTLWGSRTESIVPHVTRGRPSRLLTDGAFECFWTLSAAQKILHRVQKAFFTSQIFGPLWSFSQPPCFARGDTTRWSPSAWIFSDDDEALSHLQVALQPADAVIVSPVNLGGANTGLQMWFGFFSWEYLTICWRFYRVTSGYQATSLEMVSKLCR